MIIFLFLATAARHEARGGGVGVACDTTRGLEEVVVTGERARVASPVPVQSLAGERLERLNSLSVADAARYFSGVQLKDYGGIGGLKTVNARGLGSAHVAVLYDGMAVSDVQNGQVDLGRFSLDNVEEILLYNAQRPDVLQPARGLLAASVLSLRSRVPRFAAGERFRGRAGVTGGSFGLANPTMSWQQRLWGRAVLASSAGYLSAHGRYRHRYTNGTYDTTITRRNGDIEAARVEAGVYLPLGASTLVALKGYHYSSERGLPGAILAGRFENAQRQADRVFFLHASARGERGRGRWMVNARYSRDYSRYTDPEYLAAGGLVNTFRQEEWYGSAAGAVAVAPWCEVAVAVDVARATLASAGAAGFPDPSRVSAWGAISARARAGERLTVQVNLPACRVEERVERGERPGGWRFFCPSVAVTWQPFRDEGFRARAFYKRSARVPAFNDLYYSFPVVVALRPEVATQYDAGFSWVASRGGVAATVQGDVYYNLARDKIVAFPAGNMARWTMINLGEASVTGVDVNGRVTAALPGEASVEAGASYTWQRAVDRTPGDTRGRYIPYTPVHAGTVTAAARRGAWHVNYSFIYTGERFSRRDNAPESREAPWYTHDLSLGYRAGWRGVPFRLEAGVNNLLNRYYNVVRNYPMPGRSCRLNLSITI